MTELEFQAMINCHMSMLKANALKFTKNLDDADDLTQETLIKAYRFIGKYQKGTNLKGWLFMIMRNTFINMYQKIARRKGIVCKTDDVPNLSRFEGAVANCSPGKMVLEDIYTALNNLPEMYRYPFIRYFEGYKYEEIAQEIGIPLGTVKTHIHMAREILKKSLKSYKNLHVDELFS